MIKRASTQMYVMPLHACMQGSSNESREERGEVQDWPDNHSWEWPKNLATKVDLQRDWDLEPLILSFSAAMRFCYGTEVT